MFEFLVLGVFHDRQRLLVPLDRDALLVPADRLRFLDQRSDHSGEGPRLGAEFLRRLVILLENHGVLIIPSAQALCLPRLKDARAAPLTRPSSARSAIVRRRGRTAARPAREKSSCSGPL